MIGHEPRFTVTNSGGYVCLCSCGDWISGVTKPARNPRTGYVRQAARDLAQAVALDAHKIHVHDVRADIARRSDRELARIGTLIPAANATLQRRGRWGHP